MDYKKNKDLTQMIKELQKSPPIYQSSEFWQMLSQLHLQQLSEGGFNNFKRSVNVRYFNWRILGIIRHQLTPLYSEVVKGNFTPFLNSVFVNPKSHNSNATSFNFISSIIYKIHVSFLRDYVYRKDRLKIFDLLEEPLLGNPFLVRYKNKLISQDLCNSIHEFYSITEKINYKKNLQVAEIGAGYGRLSYVFLKTLPKISYCIIDIPPALYIAQEYLLKLMPKETTFRFRPFTSFKDVEEEFLSSRIKFLMPHQIEYLPDKIFDLMINISSLHEMTREQINNYVKNVNRLTHGYFYTKQWRKSRIRDNMFIGEKDYPIPKNWSTLYQQNHPIQNMFFEALYGIN